MGRPILFLEEIMDQKEYVELLQEAVAKSPTPDKSISPSTPRDDSTAKKIVNWDGTGDLPETLERDELDEMVDEILTKDESPAEVKEEKEEAPLDKLEGSDEAGETDNEAGLDMEIDETDMTFSDDESEILKKLITEMDELETELDLTSDEEEILDLEDELEKPAEELAGEVEGELEAETEIEAEAEAEEVI